MCSPGYLLKIKYLLSIFPLQLLIFLENAKIIVIFLYWNWSSDLLPTVFTVKKKVCLAIANKIFFSNVQLICICIEPSLELCKLAQADTEFLASIPVITDKQTQQAPTKHVVKQQGHVEQTVCIGPHFKLQR